MGDDLCTLQTAFNLKPPGALNLYCVIYQNDILLLAFCLLEQKQTTAKFKARSFPD